MPARLHFSNSLDALADRLSEIMAADGGTDPLSAPVVATPASALRDWLKFRIAETKGIAANIAFPHLESLLWDRLAERDPHRDVEERQPARLLDSFSFQGLVLAQLRRDPPEELGEYLRTGVSAEDARRLCQLSGKLAALFREYEYGRVSENGRPGLAESWMRGERCFGRLSGLPAVVELEHWQMAVYQALFRQGDGLRDRWGQASKTYRYTLPQYAEMVLGTATDAGSPELPASGIRTAPTVFHLFGLSNISPFHRDVIGRLADERRLGPRAAHFEIYALNPCAEFWEDALTPREREARAARRTAGRVDPARVREARPTTAEREQPELDPAGHENGLLALFGKPGRETVKLWCQLTEYDFFEDFREPEKNSLLATVQKSVLSRLSELSPPDADGAQGAQGAQDAQHTEGVSKVSHDASLRIRSAPDARTEMEHVRAEISALLSANPGLRPEDLAVIPADPGAALPLIRSLFAGGKDAPGNVPVLLPDADTPGDSPLLRGFRDLLAPAVLAADRNAVLALLENPAIVRKMGATTGSLRAARDFWEAAGFQEGWEDAEDTEDREDAEDEDGQDDGRNRPTPLKAGGASTALAAEERILLARVIDPNDNAVAASGFWPARGLAGLERAEATRLVSWLANLRTALRPFRMNGDNHAAVNSAAAHSPAALSFADWAGLLRDLLDGFLQAEENDAADRRTELDLRRFFTEMEQWDQWSEEVEPVPAELVRTLLEDAFRDPGAPRSAFLRGGVRIGGLSALRGIPFRHVWVTGLAAGSFPASGEAAPLDLRGFRRLPGESDPAARDLYALLEVIASVSDSLTLSWVRRDAGKDAEVPPSRALTGLRTWLESDVLAPAVFPVASLRATALPAQPQTAASRPAPAGWMEAPHEGPVHTDWDEVATYLNNPALHAVKHRFKLRPYDALDFAEEERAAALFFDNRADAALLDPVLRAELLQPGSGAAEFERFWAERARGGQLPPSPYDAVEHARLLAEVTGPIVQQAQALLILLEPQRLAFAGSLRTGPQDFQTAEPPVVSVPAFRFQRTDPLGQSFLLGGILPWFFRSSEPEGGWALLVEDGKEQPVYLLQLCLAALCGAEGTEGGGNTETPEPLRGPGHILLPDKKPGGFSLFPLPEPSAAEAKNTLRTLLEDLAAAPDFDDLPLNGIETIAEAARHNAGSGTGQGQTWSDAIEEWRRGEEEKSFGGPRFWDRILRTLRAETPEDAAEKIGRRLEPYLAWKRAWKPEKRPGGKA